MNEASVSMGKLRSGVTACCRWIRRALQLLEVFSKASKVRGARVRTGALRLEGKLSLGPKKTLFVVGCGGRRFLVGCGSETIAAMVEIRVPARQQDCARGGAILRRKRRGRFRSVPHLDILSASWSSAQVKQ